MKISEEVKQRVIELDRRYRFTWDVRSIAHVIGIGHNSVAKIVREARGPRPKKTERPHNGRTHINYRDVMWSSDFLAIPGGKLLKTLDEMSIYKLGWDIVDCESAEELVKHAEGIVESMGRAPLVWKFDNGGAFKSKVFQDFLAEHKIIPYPIPPHAPWVNGRTERDNQEIENWLLILEGREISRAELRREVDEGMLMLNYVKPRAVLGYRKSAEVYLNGAGVTEEMDREWLALNLKDAKYQLGWNGWTENRRIHRKAVRQVLLKWTLMEEWEEVPEDARIVNRSKQKNISD
jgi:transposase InsO family protein